MAPKAKKVTNGVAKADNYVVVDLHMLKSNTCQPRRNGVIPNLNEQGYGLFSQDPEEVGNASLNKKALKNEDGTDKLPIWTMLLSDKPELQALAVGLIDEHEPELKELADSIAGCGQLHNIGINPVDEKDHSKGFDIVYGCCRSIARAYNHARSVGELPANIKAEIAQDITDPHDLHFRAMQENRGRKNESLIDEAKQIQWLKKQGMTIPAIADKLQTNQQNIRNRLKLLRLTQEEQMRVHTGKLGMVKANQMVDKRDAGSAQPGETAQDKPENRKRAHTVKQMEKLYTAAVKPDDCPDEEWAVVITPDVRRYFALMLKVEYKSHRDMVAELNRQAKEALNADAIRKAAEEAEAGETPAAAAK